MSTATETPEDVKPKPLIGGGCGGCTYTYNQATKCYDRNGTGGCMGGCRCAPTICGLGAQIIHDLRPSAATTASPLSLSCATAANDEKWLALALIALAQQKIADARRRWKAAGIGLGILSVLLAIGMAAALLYR
jgi:hypothetical protein